MKRHLNNTQDSSTVIRKTLSILVALLLVSLPLIADNQVVTSSRAEALDSTTTSVGQSWQGFQEQLGWTTPQTIDLDYLQMVRTSAAIGDASYPVTVGDIYTLSYFYNNSVVEVPVMVTHSPTLSIPNIGIFNVGNRTYLDLKEEVEAAVTALYPYSNPTLTITNTGVFAVSVSGLSTTSTRVDAWGLSRLSDFSSYAGEMASTRDVTVIGADGSQAHYDLYAARREGDLSQDPLLRPGDQVVFNKRGTTVMISGSIQRPGTYQVLEDEDLGDLVNRYALGFTSAARTDDIIVTRRSGTSYIELHPSADEMAGFTLQDGDMVTVNSLSIPVGSVTIEGALVSTDTSNGNTVLGQVSSQYFYRFAVGDTVETMLRDMSQYFSASSDLDGCYLTRDGASYPLSFREILYGDDPAGDMLLQSGDRFTIPFSNQVVTVNGAVNNPGTYAYVPGKDVSYYVNLAGGLADDAKGLDKYTLYNSYGQKIADDSPITAETTVELDRSTFERDLGIAISVIGGVSTIATIVSTIVGIVNAVN